MNASFTSSVDDIDVELSSDSSVDKMVFNIIRRIFDNRVYERMNLTDQADSLSQ